MPPSLRRSIFRSLALAALLIALPAAAQTPSDESLNRLIELQDTPSQIRTILPASSDIVKQYITRRLNSDNELTPTQRTALTEVLQRYTHRVNREVFQSEEVVSELRRIQRDAMRKTYTQEEVDAMIAFYGTPLGQSVLRKQGEFAKTYMPSLINMLDIHNQQAAQRLWPDFQREIEGIMLQSHPSSGSNKRH